jgi:CubicO group peptidase (beta-lactamase class C family)
MLLLTLVLSFSLVAGLAGADKSIAELAHNHLVRGMMISGDCSAGGIIIVHDGKVIHEEYLGGVHRGKGAAKIGPQSRFPFYSITKGFGSGVILSLVSDGTISLDDPVVKYVPQFTGKGPGGTWLRDWVTIRQLASHASGVPSPGSEDYNPYLSTPPFSDVVLSFEPGHGSDYNQTAMRLLGEVIEQAAGKPYAQVLDEKIVEPLGLASVGYYGGGPDTANLVHSCIGRDNSRITVSDRPAGKANPGSGQYGTLPDIVKYAQVWLNGGLTPDGRRIFNEELIKEAWTGQPTTNQPDPDYGILFWLFPEVPAYVFSGMAHTIVAILPEQKVIVATALNQTGPCPAWNFRAEKLNAARLGLDIADRLNYLKRK